jgi:hypothetical protein
VVALKCTAHPMGQHWPSVTDQCPNEVHCFMPGRAHSIIDIQAWEFMLLVLYVFLVAVVYARRKNVRIAKNPEYKYYLWALYAKILGGLSFALIYVYYYGNGDTISFYLSSEPLAELLYRDPLSYLDALFAPNTVEERFRLFDPYTGYPMGYVYSDARTYFLVRLISPLTALTGKSFLLTGALVSTVAFSGVWKLYLTLVRYYPSIMDRLALAVLFVPSSLFWGSGIIKDTFTFSAMCWYIHALDKIFFRKVELLGSWLAVVVASIIIIAMKPYIFMLLFPASLLWLLYHRIAKIRNALVRFFVLPIGIILFIAITLWTLDSLGDNLSKFSLDKALKTMILSQEDMKRSSQYGDNYFDIGELDGTWGGVFSKIPIATFAGLFLPSLFHVENVVMLIAALENSWLLILFLSILWRTRVFFFFVLLRTNPLLQMFFFFAFSYAFMIGVTTPNFGALVRFKIPLLPLFVAGMFIADHILRERMKVLAHGRRFRFELFTDGEPGATAAGVVPISRSRNSRS